jgi:hypothetical protein
LSGVVSLSRPYTCIFGAPTLTAVHPQIFALRYFTRCMECTFCGDDCCSFGVDIDTGEAARVAALPGLAEIVGVPPSEWFTDTPVADPEFPSGAFLRTRVHNGHCVFQVRGARGCAIHSHCLDRGLDFHLYKPMVSTLFPLTFEQGLLLASDEVIDGDLICSGQGPVIYDGAREELAYYFGAGLVTELDSIRLLAHS